MVNQEEKKYDYKKILKFYKKYEYNYFKIASNYIEYLRYHNYDKKFLKKYVKNKQNKIRVLSESEFHAERSVIEAREFISYFVNV